MIKIRTISKGAMFIILCFVMISLNYLTGRIAIKIASSEFPLEQHWVTNLGDRVAKLTISKDGFVFVRTGSALYSLDSRTGVIIWKFPINSGINPSNAIVDEQEVYVSNDKIVYAINKADGDILWESLIENRIDNTEAVVQAVSPCCVLVSSLKQTLTSYDRFTGEKIAEVTSGGGDFAEVNVNGNTMYVIYKGAKIYDGSTNKTIWDEKWEKTAYEIFFQDEVVYFADGGQVAAFNFSTRSFLWSIPEIHAVYGIWGNQDYLLVEAVHLNALDPRTGERIWSTDWGGSNLVIIKDWIYLLNPQKKQVRVLDLATGNMLGWIQLALPSIIQLNYTSEAIGTYQDKLIFGVDERVYGFQQP